MELLVLKCLIVIDVALLLVVCWCAILLIRGPDAH